MYNRRSIIPFKKRQTYILKLSTMNSEESYGLGKSNYELLRKCYQISLRPGKMYDVAFCSELLDPRNENFSRFYIDIRFV